MEIRYAVNPHDFKQYSTEKIRQEFLISDLFTPGKIKMVYSHEDRIIVGGVCPLEPISLEAGKEIGAEYFWPAGKWALLTLAGKER